MTPSSVFISFAVLFAVFAISHVLAAPRYGYDCLNTIDQELGSRLSSRASIVHDPTEPSRYSSYYAPQPGVVVNVAEEKDVVETVKYCIKNNLKFLTQTGGHGFATTFNIGSKDIVINMRGLNNVNVNDAKDKITIGGGALVSEAWTVAYQNQVQSTIPTCRCVGVSGATLGGGLNVHMGRWGLAIDNLLSLNLVTAKGKLITVTPDSSPDLWWALRGAGANFGIVTSLTMKAYPQINEGVGWLGTLQFSPDRLEDLVKTLSDFDYPEDVFIVFRFTPSVPDLTPGIMVDIVYHGSQEAAKASFKALYDLEPISEVSQEVPYTEYGSIVDFACSKGLRHPVYTAGLKKLDPKTFRKIWEEYLSLSENPAFFGTGIMIEAYAHKGIRQFSDSSSAFPIRDVKFIGLIPLQYSNPTLDPVAEEFGLKIRQLLKESSGFKGLKPYINYGHGDENLKEIYGQSLSRLKKIKKKWDKNERFSQFFQIPRH